MEEYVERHIVTEVRIPVELDASVRGTLALRIATEDMADPMLNLLGDLGKIHANAATSWKGFQKWTDWFIDDRPEFSESNLANMRGEPIWVELMLNHDRLVASACGRSKRRLLALDSKERLVRTLDKLRDGKEFLSEFGIRSLSKYHEGRPWGMHVNGNHFGVEYRPVDSKSGMFASNSNWRGPILLAIRFPSHRICVMIPPVLR